MNDKAPLAQPACRACRNPGEPDIDFSVAFQPIVDISDRSVHGYEALVRGVRNESASSVLSRITARNKYRFDQSIRVRAIDLAKRLGLAGVLSINFLPNAVYDAETCIRATLEAAAARDFPLDTIQFEVTESEEIRDNHLKNIFLEYKRHKFITAIDDFGAGYAGLNLLARLEPDVVKLDMALTRNIDTDRVRRSLVFATLAACQELSIQVIAEGIETVGECLTLAERGVSLFQGYLFARPGFESLPQVPDEIWDRLR